MSAALAVTDSEVDIRLHFDGRVPIASNRPAPGDLRLTYSIALNSPGTGAAPYVLRYVAFSGPGSFLLTRTGLAGVLDSTGALHGTIGRNYVDIALQRRVVPLLTTPLSLSASTLVEYFVSTPNALGYEKLGTAQCAGSAIGATSVPEAAEGGTTTTPTAATTSSIVASPPATSTAPSSSGLTGALATIVRSATQISSDGYLAADASIVSFASPSQNIQCSIFTDNFGYVSCDIGRYDFPQPGPDCPQGATVGVGGDGQPQFAGCLKSKIIPLPGGVLPYGDSVRGGRFTCVSEETGVTCADIRTDTGFTVSTQAFDIHPTSSGMTVNCPSTIVLKAAWDAAHPGGYEASSTSGIACAFGWATAGVSVDGNAVASVFHEAHGIWTAFVDRQQPCSGHDVPPSIYEEACETG